MSVEEERLPAVLRNRILDEEVYNKDAVGALFQLKSTAKSLGNADGSWTALTTPEEDALASGATLAKIDSIEDKATIAALNAHTDNDVIHITGGERSKWNAKQDALNRTISLTGKVLGSQTDNGGNLSIATSVDLDKGDVGLDNVDNTSDIDKPVSTATQDALNTKEDKAEKGVSDGYAPLDSNAKVPLEHLPDIVMGNLVFGGVFVSAQSPYVDVNLSTNGITLLSKIKSVTNPVSLADTASSTEDDCFGYTQVEGFYFIADGVISFGGLEFEPGDWLIAAENGWHKIDNTDAVVGVKGDAENSYRIGRVNLTPADVGALPVSALSEDAPTSITNIDIMADPGNSLDVARSDHTHGFTTITPDNISTTLIAGSGTDVSTPAITVAATVSTLLQTIWNRIYALAQIVLRVPATITGATANTAGSASVGHTHAVSGLTVPVGGTGATSFTPNSAIVSGATDTGSLVTRTIASSIGSSITSISLATEGAVRDALNSLSTGPFVTGTFTNANTPAATGVYNSSGTPTNTPYSSSAAQTLMVFANGNAITQFWSSAGSNANETGTWTRSRNGASWPTASPYGWLRVGQFAAGMRITGVYVFTRAATSAAEATFSLPSGLTADTCILISAGKTHGTGNIYYYDMINQISMSSTQIIAQNVQNSQIKIAVMGVSST